MRFLHSGSPCGMRASGLSSARAPRFSGPRNLLTRPKQPPTLRIKHPARRSTRHASRTGVTAEHDPGRTQRKFFQPRRNFFDRPGFTATGLVCRAAQADSTCGFSDDDLPHSARSAVLYATATPQRESNVYVADPNWLYLARSWRRDPQMKERMKWFRNHTAIYKILFSLFVLAALACLPGAAFAQRGGGGHGGGGGGGGFHGGGGGGGFHGGGGGGFGGGGGGSFGGGGAGGSW